MTTVNELVRKEVVKRIEEGEMWKYLLKYGRVDSLRIYESNTSYTNYLVFNVLNRNYQINVTDDLKDLNIENIVAKLEIKIIDTVFSMDWRTLRVLAELIKNVSRQEV